MSRIYFHAPHRTTEVRGSERAYMAGLASDMALAVLSMSDQDRDWIIPFLRDAPEYVAADLASEKRESRYGGFSTWFHVAHGGGFELAGQFVGCTELALNTLIATRSPVLSLMAHLHGWCEEHGFVEAENARWLGDIIRNGRHDSILRPEQGWEDVLTLLAEVVESGQGPVVTSYSVCESFPNRYLLGSEFFVPWTEGQEENPEDDAARERWEKLSNDEAWALATDGLRTREYRREISPEEQDIGYQSGASAFDLMAARWAERWAAP